MLNYHIWSRSVHLVRFFDVEHVWLADVDDVDSVDNLDNVDDVDDDDVDNVDNVDNHPHKYILK